MTKDYIPYTYLLGWTSQRKYYYGSSYGKNKIANPIDLWISYFSSSKIVQQFRKEYGEPDIIQVRKTFKTAEETNRFEQKVLCRLHQKDPFHLNESKWLNANVRGHILNDEKFYQDTSDRQKKIWAERKSDPKFVAWSKGRKMSDKQKKQISEKQKKKAKEGRLWSQQPENKNKIATWAKENLSGRPKTSNCKEKLRNQNLGKVCYNDGENNYVFKPGDNIPAGLEKGMLKRTKKLKCQNCEKEFTHFNLDRHTKNCINDQHNLRPLDP